MYIARSGSRWAAKYLPDALAHVILLSKAFLRTSMGGRFTQLIALFKGWKLTNSHELRSGERAGLLCFAGPSHNFIRSTWMRPVGIVV